jgi:replicative DNA helicase
MKADEPARLRVPPHSAEAEQAVLGALMLDNSAWDRCGDMLREGDFYVFAHRQAYKAIASLITANKAADVLTVAAASECELGELNSYTMSVPSAASIRTYAAIVKQRAVLRTIALIGDNLSAEAFQVDVPPEKIVDRALTALMGLEHGDRKGEPRSISELVVEFVDSVSAAHEGKTNAIATGLADLDAMLNGGLRPGELVVIGARPSMGKTATVLTLLRHISEQRPALGLTLEDSLMALTGRMVASSGRINLADIRNPAKAPDSMWEGLTEGTEAVGRLLLDLDDEAGLTLMDVRRKIQQTRRKYGGKPLGLVVIDYLQLMEGDGDNRNQSLGYIANGLKKAAKDFECPIVLLSQLNREADKRSGPPQMSDLRDSGDIEGAADIIALLYREFQRKPSPENKHHMEVHIVKHKNGATGTVNLHFDGPTQRLSNWSGPAPSKGAARAKTSSKGGME